MAYSKSINIYIGNRNNGNRNNGNKNNERQAFGKNKRNNGKLMWKKQKTNLGDIEMISPIETISTIDLSVWDF